MRVLITFQVHSATTSQGANSLSSQISYCVPVQAHPDLTWVRQYSETVTIAKVKGDFRQHFSFAAHATCQLQHQGSALLDSQQIMQVHFRTRRAAQAAVSHAKYNSQGATAVGFKHSFGGAGCFA